MLDKLIEAILHIEWVRTSSAGVAGYHLNDTLADWEDVLPEEWDEIVRMAADRQADKGVRFDEIIAPMS